MRDDSEAIDNDPPVTTPEEPSMTPFTVAARLSFLVAAVATTLTLFASAADIADIEHAAAVARLAQAAAASQPRVLVAAGTTSRK